MQKSWTIQGAYGDWSITVTLAPNGQPGTSDEAEGANYWPHHDFDSISSHFYDVVGMHELGLVVDAK